MTEFEGFLDKKLRHEIWTFQPLLYHGNTTTGKTKALDTFLRFKPRWETFLLYFGAVCELHPGVTAMVRVTYCTKY